MELIFGLLQLSGGSGEPFDIKELGKHLRLYSYMTSCKIAVGVFEVTNEGLNSTLMLRLGTFAFPPL